MACSGTLAFALDFIYFWCIEAMLVGYDDGGAVGNMFLTDTAASFIADGVQIGSPVKNVTKGTYGTVTNVAVTILVTTIAFDDGDEYQVAPISHAEAATITATLGIATSDIFAAMAASGQCDCTLADWALGFLKKLTLIDAMVLHNCPCGNANLTDAMKQTWLRWMSEQLSAIRDGKLELCAGETGNEYPALGWAQMGYTEAGRAEIIIDEERS